MTNRRHQLTCERVKQKSPTHVLLNFQKPPKPLKIPGMFLFGFFKPQKLLGDEGPWEVFSSILYMLGSGGLLEM